MNLTIKYFGMLAEATQCQEEEFLFSQESVSDLLKMLFVKYPELEEKDFQVAQNNQIVSKDSKIETTEIALLPPFAGG
ncbi:MoaD/ThiS family protein [Aureisphaera galaxeae]|uniref:MoaD/ThiS family protein n=1 Tax=Aureisphaera galaxeae TaxID=1538023 RepID=UPI002350E72D|nr:MoaD/ThiS family protein [Aureisphaera galaxeae]MDC8002476.1 MoaD/ThiS family protein [Aureisphaera galaxeae]